MFPPSRTGDISDIFCPQPRRRGSSTQYSQSNKEPPKEDQNVWDDLIVTPVSLFTVKLGLHHWAERKDAPAPKATSSISPETCSCPYGQDWGGFSGQMRQKLLGVEDRGSNLRTPAGDMLWCVEQSGWIMKDVFLKCGVSSPGGPVMQVSEVSLLQPDVKECVIHRFLQNTKRWLLEQKR